QQCTARAALRAVFPAGHNQLRQQAGQRQQSPSTAIAACVARRTHRDAGPALSPKWAKARTAMSQTIRYESVVPRALRELTILRTAQLMGGEYEVPSFGRSTPPAASSSMPGPDCPSADRSIAVALRTA